MRYDETTQLPAPPAPAVRYCMEHSQHHTNQGTLTTSTGSEPVRALWFYLDIEEHGEVMN